MACESLPALLRAAGLPRSLSIAASQDLTEPAQENGIVIKKQEPIIVNDIATPCAHPESWLGSVRYRHIDSLLCELLEKQKGLCWLEDPRIGPGSSHEEDTALFALSKAEIGKLKSAILEAANPNFRVHPCALRPPARPATPPRMVLTRGTTMLRTARKAGPPVRRVSEDVRVRSRSPRDESRQPRQWPEPLSSSAKSDAGAFNAGVSGRRGLPRCPGDCRFQRRCQDCVYDIMLLRWAMTTVGTSTRR